MKRGLVIAALALAAAFAYLALRDRSPAPVEEDIDEASREALREILRQEEE